DLRIILKVAECQSITAAAIELDMRTATASAAVKRVENMLGVELFTRTTRQLRLSPAGEKYIPQCQQALQLLEQAEQNLKSDLDIVDGTIRIALSSDLGRNVVTPWLDEFLTTYPNVSLRANITDSNVDFYRDSVDIALRYGSPKDSNLYGFKLCDVPRVLCASPSYIAANGEPKHPSELVTHNALLYQLHDVIHDVWHFDGENKEYKMRVRSNRASNDGDLVRRWCASGQGLAVKSCLDMANDLLSGNVVSVMTEFKPTPTELWLIFPSRQSITPASRLLRDLLKEKTADLLNQLREEGIIDSPRN
ncbi:LysR family transcriptional regulator, partial [Photobacterium sanctipauli]